MNRQNFFYSFIIILLCLSSFFLYSSLFYPLLNSDNAVTILMVHYFKLPGDFYFWGQDRLGSLIPLISQIPNKLLGLSPILSESIVHYGILLAGFLAFSTFIRSHFYKVIFAIIWFFPPMRLIDVTQFAFGIHYSLIAIICYLIKKLTDQEKILTPIRYYSTFTAVAFLMITTIWVSDMAIVSAGLLIMINLFLFHKNRNPEGIHNRNSFIIFSIAGSLVGYLFIHYAKSLTKIKNTYSTFGDLNMVMTSSKTFLKSIKEFLTFTSDEPLTNIYVYLTLILAGSILLSLKFFKLSVNHLKFFFLINLERKIIFTSPGIFFGFKSAR